MKPYVKIAYSLIVVGMGLFTLERLGLAQLGGLHGHLSGWMINAMVLVPIGLVVAGGAVFMIGRMRRM